jgi:uncharacterized protein (DUF885 family)
MRRRDLLRGTAGAATWVMVAASPVSAATGQPDDVRSRFEQLVREGQRADDALNPLRLVRRGERPIGALFVDPFSDAYATQLEANKRKELIALDAIDRSALLPGDRIAWDVFRYQAEQALEEIDSGVFATRRLAPLDASFGLHVEFPDYMSGATGLETVQDYEDRLIQLNGFVAFMVAQVDRLRSGMEQGYHQPQVVVRNVISQVEAFLAVPVEQSPLYAPVSRFPDAVSVADRTRLEAAYRQAIETGAYPAYALWRTFLRDEYLPKATEGAGLWAMKDGDRVYASDLVHHTTTQIAADDIHRVGLTEVARIRDAMEDARQATGFQGDLPALFEHVRTEPSFYYSDPADLIAHFERIGAEVWRNMPKLFSRRPRAAFEVRPLPTLGDQRGTGYYRAGPPDASRPGVLYFNMAMLGTRPIPTLETLALHEGVPGHHYQISLVQEDASLPDILRFRLAPATAYSEGWGLYAESLGRDLGLFTDPYQYFGHLDMEMLRAVRLVVDTGLHALRWDRQRAVDYMLANTSMAERDVAVEIDRYITSAGQACAYKIGELKIQELKRRARQAQGGGFDIRRFHDQVLDTGALPLDVLEAKIDGWLAEA